MAHNGATTPGRASRAAKSDFWYYDRLPPTARTALANAVFDWSSAAAYNRWNRGQRGYKTGADIAKQIKSWDAGAIGKTRGSNR